MLLQSNHLTIAGLADGRVMVEGWEEDGKLKVLRRMEENTSPSGGCLAAVGGQSARADPPSTIRPRADYPHIGVSQLKRIRKRIVRGQIARGRIDCPRVDCLQDR